MQEQKKTSYKSLLISSSATANVERLFLFIIMKLFITNKNEFDVNFTRKDYRDSFYKTPREIHINAFNELSQEVANGKIPIIIAAEYKDLGFALFQFVGLKNDVYFYEYNGTAS